MKLITAIIQPDRLDSVREALILADEVVPAYPVIFLSCCHVLADFFVVDDDFDETQC